MFVSGMPFSVSAREQAFQTLTGPSRQTLFLDPSLINISQLLPGDEYIDHADIRFDTQAGETMIQTIEQGVAHLQKKLVDLDKEIGPGNPGYEQIRRDVVAVIDEIINHKNTLSESLERIKNVERVVFQGAQRLEEIRSTIDQTKNVISTLTTALYELSHRIYDQHGNIDDLKLFINDDKEISTTTLEANQYHHIITRLDELVQAMNSHQSQQARRIRISNENKRRLREEIASFGAKVQNLEQKRKLLIEYLELYRVNRERMGNRAINIFETRRDIHDSIVATIEEIKTRKFTAPFDVDQKLEELRNLEPYAEFERSAELSWPIMPVSQISRKFKDPDFQAQYGFSFMGIEIPAPQQTPLYAADDGIVYRTVIDTGLGVSRFLLMHRGGYLSIYQFPSIVLVRDGDIVRRGQLIGYSGGEPGTPGAGFISKRPNLTFMVVNNFQFQDPLNVLDLSIFKPDNNLTLEYKIKYLQDIYRRPRDLYKVEFIPGSSLNERRQNFLDLYAVGIYRSLAFWMDAAAGSNIDLDVGICIGFAESSMGRFLTTENNIGNVGNNDRGDRIGFNSALEGARLIYSTLNNQYLGHYHTIIELNGYGNKRGAIYASSPYNRQNNVVKCLSMIKGYYVPDDFPFRTGPNPRKQ
ncbi:MAG: peptidoglycan DD-metalloendopeptidase family protein [Candidatus Absconditabacterales bacterium]|nr:peptidoglycan DD-metalloendopeptidase family protein [Candidatus Absconditabacterales bacterium]